MPTDDGARPPGAAGAWATARAPPASLCAGAEGWSGGTDAAPLSSAQPRARLREARPRKRRQWEAPWRPEMPTGSRSSTSRPATDSGATCRRARAPRARGGRPRGSPQPTRPCAPFAAARDSRLLRARWIRPRIEEFPAAERRRSPCGAGRARRAPLPEPQRARSPPELRRARSPPEPRRVRQGTSLAVSRPPRGSESCAPLPTSRSRPQTAGAPRPTPRRSRTDSPAACSSNAGRRLRAPSGRRRGAGRAAGGRPG